MHVLIICFGPSCSTSGIIHRNAFSVRRSPARLDCTLGIGLNRLCPRADVPEAEANAERNAKLLSLTSPSVPPVLDDGKVWQTDTRETQPAGRDPTIPPSLPAENGHVAQPAVWAKAFSHLASSALVDNSNPAPLDRAQLPILQATKSLERP